MSDGRRYKVYSFEEVQMRHRPKPSGDWLLDELRSLKALVWGMELGPERDRFVRCIEKTRAAWQRARREREKG